MKRKYEETMKFIPHEEIYTKYNQKLLLNYKTSLEWYKVYCHKLLMMYWACVTHIFVVIRRENRGLLTVI